MERLDVPRVRLVGVRGSCLLDQRAQGPGVANRATIDGCAVLWPDGDEEGLQEIPECENVES